MTRSRRRRALRALLLLFALPLLGLVGLAAYVWTTTPLPGPGAVRMPQLSEIRWSDGATLATIGAVNREAVQLEDVSLAARHAVLAAEDRDYATSPAVSPRAVLRAAWADLRGRDTSQGGSTIEQQYSRAAFLTPERTWSRKLHEAVLAIKLGRSRSKDEILDSYLNTVYFGRGAYGIEAAAQTFFGVPASQLTAAQGAVLAAQLSNPAGNDPVSHPDVAHARWRYVLDGMVGQGWLDGPAEAQGYPDLLPRTPARAVGGTNGYLVQHALAELAAQGVSEDVLDAGGLVVETTFDEHDQAAAVSAVQGVMGADEPGVYRALVSVEPGTGKVRAEYGGSDFLARPYNSVTQGTAQAGSSFKPYVLAAALQSGVSLNSVFDGSSPQRHGDYVVHNFAGETFGDIDVLTATAESVNTVYVQLGLRAGLSKVASTAASLGIRADLTRDRATPTLSLGVTSVTPLEQANAYATLAAGGVRSDPHVVERVTDRDGLVLFAATPASGPVLDPKIAADVTYALRGVVQHGTGRAAALPGRPVAGKTGTTSGNTAAWFVGYTPHLATAVALYSERADAPLRGVRGVNEVTGGTLPARTWSRYTGAALAGAPVVSFPEPAFVGTPVQTPAPAPTLSPLPPRQDTPPAVLAAPPPDVDPEPAPAAPAPAATGAAPAPARSPVLVPPLP